MPRRFWTSLGVYWALAAANCTFPNYNTPPPGAGGSTSAGDKSGGSAGSAGSGGSSGTSAASGAGDVLIGGNAGAGGAEELGGAPQCAPEQWPVDRCEGGCLHRYPTHCYDGMIGDGEVAVDCGGSCQGCTTETCGSDRDCLSGECQTNVAGESACHAPLTLSYTPHERNNSVGSTAWSLSLLNDEPTGGQMFMLKDIELRYYFERSGIVEPLLVRATQANLQLADGESQALSATSWSVERLEDAPNTVYDAYVATAFGDSGQLLPGDHVELYQQMLTGDPASSNFDQRSNYSYTDQEGVAWLHIAIFYRGKLVWGLEPQPSNPRACFVRGVNLNGPALAIAGHDWQSASQASVTTTGSGVSQGGTPFPIVTGSLATMLQTATWLQTGNQLSLPVDNGTYLAYLYATSPGNDATPSVFTVQGAEPDISSKFRSQPADGGQAWAKLGPFRVDVTDGTLNVGVTTGAVSFTGLELWYPD